MSGVRRGVLSLRVVEIFFSMEFSDEPEKQKGGSKDENPMGKDESWFEITRKCKTGTERGNGWGKSYSAQGNGTLLQVQSQGMTCKGAVHDFFVRNTMHKSPVLITNALGSPASINGISDKDILNETRLNAQEAVQAMHKVLISEYGPLDLAPKPVWGQKIPLQIKIESKDLFGQPDWHEVLETILKKDFIIRVLPWCDSWSHLSQWYVAHLPHDLSRIQKCKYTRTSNKTYC